jgi:hypothetical protein
MGRVTKQAMIDQLTEQLSTAHRRLRDAEAQLRGLQSQADIDRRATRIRMEAARREAAALGRPVSVRTH